MEPIVCGSTTERIIRTALVTLLAVFASLWSFYDGYVGYPAENLEKATKDLVPKPDPMPKIIEDLNSDTCAELRDSSSLQEVRDRWGEPGWTGESLTSTKSQKRMEDRYFGPAGVLVVTYHPLLEQVESFEYAEVGHGKMDLRMQKFMGLGAGIIGLLLLVHLARVLLKRTSLTEEGLKTTGTPRVPLDNITAMRSDNYIRKGWIEFDYDLDGTKGTVALNDYHAARFKEIIAEVCRRKDWVDPVAKRDAEKRAARSGQSQPPDETSDPKQPTE